MSIAAKESRQDCLSPLIEGSSLEFSVRKSLATFTEFSIDQIITQSNQVKYYDVSKPENKHDYLGEVFRLMKELNETGLNSDLIGQVSRGGRNFRDTLRRAGQTIVEKVGTKQQLTYVELGPEPVKTGHILKQLLASGIDIGRYVAVDINPASSDYMREALSDILPNAQLDFVQSTFQDFRLEDFLPGCNMPALVTMLGFQEGNDEPETVNGWLGEITRPGDLLLSESQLFDPENNHVISGFYADPRMQRFSRIAFEQAISNTLPSLNRFFLLPVSINSTQTAYVAILGEEYVNRSGVRKLFISNYCLKLTKSQYKSYRTNGKIFHIIGENETEDQTIAFQVCERLPN